MAQLVKLQPVATVVESTPTTLKLFDLSDAEIARLHGPIGLDLGSKMPAEIAVSIVAEITAVKNGVNLLQKKEGSAMPEAAGVCARG